MTDEHTQTIDDNTEDAEHVQKNDAQRVATLSSIQTQSAELHAVATSLIAILNRK